MGTEASGLPLVVDLDGALIKTNAQDETLLSRLRHGTRAVWRTLSGHAEARGPETQLSEIESWPVREDFLDYIRAQAEAGRRVVLATAADRAVADAVAARFPFISEVIAANSGYERKASAKASLLRGRYPGGFIYAGTRAADLAVWREAAGRVVVNARGGVTRRAERMGETLAVFPRSGGTLSALYRSLRLHQWVKNALVFVPLVLGGMAGNMAAWSNALLGFAALGFAVSATYVINDLWDLPNDRRHWAKRSRPLASGDLSIRGGALLAAAGLVVGFGIAALIGTAELTILAVYVVASLVYSFFLKRVPILDVLVLASLFTLRLGLGIVVVDVRLSPWLLVFSMFLFLSLSMAKRHTEVLRLGERGIQAMPGRGYVAADAPLTLGLGLAAMLGAVLIFTMYLIEDAFPRELYRDPSWLWIIPSALFLFLGRVWLLSQRNELPDDPVAFALKDSACLMLGIAVIAGFGAAVFGIGWR